MPGTPPTTGIAPPPGWTNDYDEMGGDYEWADNGVAVLMANRLGLAKPIPRYSQVSKMGEFCHLIEADSKFYLWNPVEGDLFLITEPTTLSEIVATITNQGLTSIKCEEVNT